MVHVTESPLPLMDLYSGGKIQTMSNYPNMHLGKDENLKEIKKERKKKRGGCLPMDCDLSENKG